MNDSTLPILNPRTLTPALNPLVVVDGAGLEKVKAYLSRVDVYAHDYETTVTPTFFSRRVRTLQLGDRNEQYVIDFLAFAETPEALYKAQGGYRREMDDKHAKLLQPILDIVGPSLQSKSHLKIGQNLAFEYETSKWCLGLRCWNYFCTMIAERVITNGKVLAMQAGHFALDDLVRKYCHFLISKDLQTSFNLEDPLTEDQIIYCALDCRLPFSIKSAQDAQISSGGLSRTIQIENDAIPAFGDMALNGMWVNPVDWAAIIEKNKAKLKDAYKELDRFFIPVVGRKPAPFDAEEFAQIVQEREELGLKSAEEIRLSAEILAVVKNPELKRELQGQRTAIQEARKARYSAVNELYKSKKHGATKLAAREAASMEGEANINYSSHPQLLQALLDGPFGLDPKKFLSTDEKKMLPWAKLPVIKAILEFRGYEKKLSTYGEAWIKTRNELVNIEKKKKGYVDPDTGRIHSKFLQLGTDTGRASCTNPNLFNLPKDEDVRGCFQSRLGYVEVCRDCAGQELRIIVEYSQEPSWLEAFRNKQDLHSISGEMLSPDSWRKAALMQEKQIIKNGKVIVLPPCAYYHQNKSKCSCPEHKTERDKLKNINFGVAYDKQAYTVSLELEITETEAELLLRKWHGTFKMTSSKLSELREKSYEKGEARDLAGRRRYISKVTWEQAEKSFIAKYKKTPTQDQITKRVHYLIAAVKREGGNMPIQGTAASQMKLAMGCGFDPEGKPYLWHQLEPDYGALICNFVYDEFLVETPEEHGQTVYDVVADAIFRSGAEFVKSVPMESEGGVSTKWKK